MHTPKQLIPWLTCTTSLTDKLRLCAGDAQLHVLKHILEDSNTWDYQVLGIQEKRVVHREIVMYAHQTPCWYARTILPEETIEADKTLFDRLQQESLGQLIFHSGRIKRMFLKTHVIVAPSLEITWLPTHILATDISDKVMLWCRLSEFALKASEHRFYLFEMLLPGLEQFL